MKELSIEEMTSARGGFFNIGIINATGNSAQANPVSLQFRSNNAAGFSTSGGGGVTQLAEAESGNQNVIQNVF